MTRCLDETSRKFGMEISAEKSKLLVISSKPTKIEADIEIDNVKLEQVDPFKYLGCTMNQNGKSLNELRRRTAIAQADHDLEK